MRAGLAICVPAALILAAAVSWLSPSAPAEEPSAAGASAAPALTVEGIVVREEATVPEPDGEYAVLAAEGGRVAASGALLAYSDTREGLVQAVRDAARQSSSVQRLALREAARAAAEDRPEGAFLLRAINSADTGADYSLVTAPESALWSGGTDGLELLSAASLEDVSVSALRSLMGSEPDAAPAAGKLVFTNTWRFAALFPAREAPEQGDRVELSLGGLTVTAEAEYVSEAYSGARAVVLRCGEALAQVLDVRLADAAVRVLQAGE